MGIVIRQSIKGTVVNYLGSFVGFIMTFFIMIRFLTAEEVGLTRVLVDAALLFSGLAQLGTTSSLFRFYPHFQNKEKKDHGIFFWSLLIPFIGFFIVLAVFLLCKPAITGFFAENSALFVDYYNYLIPLSFFLLYISVFETNSNVLMRIVVPKFIREIAIRLMLIVVYLLYAFKVFDLNTFVMLFCGVYGIALLLNIFYFFKLDNISLKPNIDFISKPIRKEFFFYTIFLVVAALGGAITPMINSLFLGALMGLEHVAIFTVATYIAAIIEIPYRSLGAIISPQISQAVKENDITTTNTLCKSVSLHQLLAGCFIFYFIWINIDVIFQVIPKGDEYAAGKWAVFIIGLSRLLNSVFSVGLTALTFSKYYYTSLFFTFILTALAIVLNIIWIPIWGVYGAVLGTLVSYLVYYLLLLGIVQWKIKVSLFSFGQIKIVAVLLGLFLLNWLWELGLAPLFAKLPFNEVINIVLNRLTCSVMMLVIGVTAVYKLKISEQVNLIADKAMSRIKG